MFLVSWWTLCEIQTRVIAIEKNSRQVRKKPEDILACVGIYSTAHVAAVIDTEVTFAEPELYFVGEMYHWPRTCS